jgi:seryl-tRNA synthetase
VPTDELKKCLKEPTYVLAPAQCEPFYHLLSRLKPKLEDMPVKFFDRSGWTYRWEGGAVEGLVRVQEFRRIEFVYAGKPEDVVEIRDSVKDKSIRIAEDLGLEWRVLAATPFYMRTGGIEEDVSDSRKVATYDLEVRLPYRDGWLELGSYNVSRTKFNKTFRIREVKGREIWTGCCGFGSSRWALGFLAQHGFDQTKWPRKVMERMGNR